MKILISSRCISLERITDGQTKGNIRFREEGEVGKMKSSGILLRGSGWGGGSGIHYSLKILPIIHFIKILGYSLKLDQLFIKS